MGKEKEGGKSAGKVRSGGGESQEEWTQDIHRRGTGSPRRGRGEGLRGHRRHKVAGCLALSLVVLLSSSVSGWSSYFGMVLLALEPPITSYLASINHLEAFSSAVREEGYGSHPHEMARPAVSRAFVGLWLEE